eukprot:CAMPEP_0175833374 /NCGR_PEP_ID=MMETSP0107_2-20121207/15476_1 /TAXON_ID=195067 ORGANISM="Goniomonas pacifica, Strain CCMP1869" /NCGR_SAMPLE_ID=MMETSP0107_2 /ASSEMBLY_ACC=CAM_ASM_000203 /LENGTH=116 /DNA_ID=CAMNT_0017146499 /DNA_START=695 /DNA_END=1043 /DNA_ORIENTATION=-
MIPQLALVVLVLAWTQRRENVWVSFPLSRGAAICVTVSDNSREEGEAYRVGRCLQAAVGACGVCVRQAQAGPGPQVASLVVVLCPLCCVRAAQEAPPTWGPFQTPTLPTPALAVRR